MQYHLNGFDIKGTEADFIDKATKKMFNDMDDMFEAQREAAEKLAQSKVENNG